MLIQAIVFRIQSLSFCFQRAEPLRLGYSPMPLFGPAACRAGKQASETGCPITDRLSALFALSHALQYFRLCSHGLVAPMPTGPAGMRAC